MELFSVIIFLKNNNTIFGGGGGGSHKPRISKPGGDLWKSLVRYPALSKVTYGMDFVQLGLESLQRWSLYRFSGLSLIWKKSFSS